jgi:hypothetical protein
VRDEELIERVAALKHDLAKYVAWTSANLGEEVWDGEMDGELVGALQADILRTRKGREGPESAWEVWHSLSEDLPRPLAPELQSVAEAVETLASFARSLEEGDAQALAPARPTIRGAQMQIRAQLRSLHRRLLQEGA